MKDKKTVLEVIAKDASRLNNLELETTDLSGVKQNLVNIEAVGKAIVSFLIEGVDYGEFANKKDTLFLYKKGADKIISLYGIRIDVDLVENTHYEKGGIDRYRAIIKCDGYTKDGVKFKTTFGACDTGDKADSSRTLDGAIKMAQKRATSWLVASLGAVSAAFKSVQAAEGELPDNYDLITNTKALNLFRELEELWPEIKEVEALAKKKKLFARMQEIIYGWNKLKGGTLKAVVGITKDEYKEFLEFLVVTMKEGSK